MGVGSDHSNTYCTTYAGGGNYEINKSSLRQFSTMTNSSITLNDFSDNLSLTVNAGASP